MADTNFTSGTVIASAWLDDVNTATYNQLTAVAGTNTITGTGPLSISAYATGQVFKFIPANANTGAVTINVSGLGAKAITKLGTAALVTGDLLTTREYMVAYDGTQFQLLNPTISADNFTGTLPVANGGTGAVAGQAAKSNLLVPPIGQCRLTKSGANLLLSRFNGSYININGLQEVIPSAGVTLAPTGNSNNTLYYIYVFMSAGTMTMEFSATVPVVDSTTGVVIKTADATRTLVGMAITNAGAATWTDTAAYRGVISYFNRRPIQATINLTANISTASASFVEIDTSYRVSALSWSGDVIDNFHDGYMNNSVVGTANLRLHSVAGGAGVGALDASTSFTAAGVSYVGSAHCRATVTAAADGLATIGVYGATAAGTMAVVGSGTTGSRSHLAMVVQG